MASPMAIPYNTPNILFFMVEIFPFANYNKLKYISCKFSIINKIDTDFLYSIHNKNIFYGITYNKRFTSCYELLSGHAVCVFPAPDTPS